ncbi:MAG: hypothetical protein QF441_14390 [Bacteriovoracaceae bacterium]|jgi:hypothetical protein|nr:hypothetical protein [Halobacteriovoraceae bacterium]MDP7321793.1 hypothetical protein [Bacteriovoracaceae bacterium]
MKILCLLYIIILSGCTQLKQAHQIDSVSVTSEKKTDIKISKSSPSQINTQNEKKEIVQKKLPVVALHIYPSLYHTFASIDFIKKLESKTKVSMISSQGFGALIAALYAKEASVSYLEWKLFEVVKSLQGLTPFSQTWIKTINSFVENEFGQLKLNQLKIAFVHPELNNNKIRMNQKDKVVDVLKKTLDLNHKKNFLLSPRVLNNDFERSGADLTFNIAFLPKKITFSSLSGFEWGLYTRYLGFLVGSSDEIRKIYSQERSALDKLAPLSDYLAPYSEGINESIDFISEQIESWEEESTTGINGF